MNSIAKPSLQNGKYLINRVLGQNALSVTLQGVHARSNRLIVLKTLKSEWQQHSNFSVIKQRFQEQLDRFARCQHPGLVRILDTFEEDGLPFAVMDYVRGQTLQEVVTANGSLAEDSAIQYIQQLGSALTELHRHGLVHRDVTPKNIIRPSNANIVVLINFGLVDPLKLGFSSEQISPLVGAYAAIEQYQPQFPVTPATDIYALAGTLYFLLTGHPPLSASRRGDSRLPSPRQYRPQLSSTIEAAILRGLELNPKKRPVDVASWLSLLLHTDSPTIVPATRATEQMTKGTDSSKVNKEFSVGSDRSHLRSEVSPKGKPLNYPVNTSSAIASSKHFPKVVFSTVLVAASVGLGIGLMLRIAASSTGPGASFFHSEQSFPVLDNWPGTVDPVDPPSAYSSPQPYNAPATSEPFTQPQPTESTPVAPAPEIAPLPEQAAEEIAPVPTPAPEIAPPPETSSSSEAAPEPVPAPVEVAPPPLPEPAPPAPTSQVAPPDGASTETPAN